MQSDSAYVRRSLVEGFLREYRNKRVLFYPNSGNAGDALIAYSTAQCFRRWGVNFGEVGLDADVAGKTIFLGGGGNFIPQYGTIRKALTAYAGKAKRLVLLPHTIRGNEDLIATLPREVTVFCRDVQSYEHVLAVGPKAEVYLAHDMAFHLDPEALLFQDPPQEEFQRAFVERLAERKLEPRHIAERESVTYARQDEESTGKLGKGDLDISAVFSFGVWGRSAEKSSWAFLEAIRLANAITTDRLHVAIGSALLGKPCTLFDNSYGKNKGVYNHSLRSWSSVELTG